MHLSEAFGVLESRLKKSPLLFEIYGISSSGLEIEAKKGKVHFLEQSFTQGLALRLFERKKHAKKGRFGFSYCTEWTAQSLKKMIDRARASLSAAALDPYIRLPEIDAVKPLHLELFDPEYESRPAKDKIDCAMIVESSAKKAGREIKGVESATYSEEIVETLLVNSLGTTLHKRETAYFISLQAIAAKKNDSTSSHDFQYSPIFSELQAAHLGEKTAWRAIESLGARSLSSGSYAVVLENRAVCDLLECIMPAFSAQSVQKHRSYLEKKIGKKIFAGSITIVDDATLPKLMGSYSFDGEGVPGSKTVLVEAGKLKSYLYDSYSARKARKRPTGNAIRHGFQTLPHIESSNLYLQPGNNSDLVADLSQGLFIRELLGLHTANPISGDFSFGAAGFYVKRGKIVYPVHNLTFSGNLFTLFAKVEAIGNDLFFCGPFGAPSLGFAKLPIGGKG